MAHLHPTLDVVVSGFVGYQGRVLLVKHKKLGLWLGPGGHVEPGETFDQALYRELREETGLEIGTHIEDYREPEDILRRLKWQHWNRDESSRQQYRPAAVELHDFAPLPGHQHLCLVYFLYGIGQDTERAVRLNKEEHDEIRWFDEWSLGTTEMLASIRWYGAKAIEASRIRENR